MGPNSYRRQTVPKSAQGPKIGFSSYVDIAVNIISRDTDLETLKDMSTKHCATAWKTGQDHMHDVQSPDVLRSEWTAQIQGWQETYHNGGTPVKHLASVTELQLGALFLQHPEPALSLWTVMQAFYALDRLVCCKSATELEKVSKWESMSIAAYLEANAVEKTWRTSLPALRKEIRENTKSPRNNFPFGASNGHGPEPTTSRAKKEALQRTDGIAAGIAKLEDAQVQMRKTWKSQLGEIQIMDSMLDMISKASEVRFSMIRKTDTRHDEGETDLLPEAEEIRSLKRRDSFKIVKRELESAWRSTERGDASPIAIVILLILLACLHKLRKSLIAGSEISYDG
ncbi:hypothetical protein ACEPPN_012138 [Leptodophora sp. 'Broadleaf-Isolate-01']